MIKLNMLTELIGLMLLRAFHHDYVSISNRVNRG